MDLRARKENRLGGHDYSTAGYYFVTLCVKDRHEILGEVVPVGARIARPQIILSDTGTVVDTAIRNIGAIYPSASVDKYVIMPNHIHLILILREIDRGRAMRAPTIATIINQMKGYATKQIGYTIWQKLYHDHIIRGEAEYLRIWEYVDANPAKWADDEYYTNR
ncbi:MAG: hypothetical protein LBN99_00640 [Oscillospiraceae bacterium]|jgi:REP element-mobilizing transposase RayT|nr:hypothetical protein [Oscillospiraceae bacterium]